MEVYVNDTNYNKLDVINNYQSLIWAKRYNKFGDFEIVIPANESNLNIFRQGTYVTRSDDDMTGLIEKIELQTTQESEQVIISGRDSRALLNRRVDIGQRNVVNKSLEEHLKAIISENLYNVGNRSLSAKEIYNLPSTGIFVSEQTENIVIGDYISEQCYKYGYGFRFNALESYFVFTLFKGTDRRYEVLFSKNRDNLSSSSYVEDKTNFANVIIMQDESSGVKKVTMTNGENSGFNRFEAVSDSGTSSAVDLTQEQVAALWPGGTWSGASGTYYYHCPTGLVAIYFTNEETKMILQGEFYTSFMNSKAESILAEKGIVTTLTPAVLPNITHKYKQDYFVGDIVGVEDAFNTYAVRVSGAVESWDQSGYNLDLELEALS